LAEILELLFVCSIPSEFAVHKEMLCYCALTAVIVLSSMSYTLTLLS